MLLNIYDFHNEGIPSDYLNASLNLLIKPSYRQVMIQISFAIRKSNRLISTTKKWAFPGLFFFIFVFSIQLTVKYSKRIIADDGIRTADLTKW